MSPATLDGFVRRLGPIPLWIAAAAVVLTVIFGDLPGNTQYMAVLQNGCHAPAFAVLSLIGQVLLTKRVRPALARALTVVLAMVLVGIATEGVQSLIGRDAELEDVSNDLAGAAGGMALWLNWQWRRRTDTSARIGRIAGLVVCAAAAAYWLLPLAQCAQAYWERWTQFPVLAQFRSPRDLYFVSSSGTDTRIVAVGPHDGGLALQTVLDSGPWPGITLFELMPDWRGYHRLEVDLSNAGQTALPLNLRVNDRAHRGETDDRFNLELVLQPAERRTLSIPLESIASSPRSRRMDMSQISQLILFRGGGAPNQVVRLHRIWLE